MQDTGLLLGDRQTWMLDVCHVFITASVDTKEEFEQQ
jgi:hypothetical protein